MTTSQENQVYLEALLARIIPQWSKRLRRRWVKQFLPHWREDLLERARLERYLSIALRRGWFDSPAQTGRWSYFVRLLERARDRGEDPSAVDAVNLFNLAALIPLVVAQEGDGGAIDGELWSGLVAGEVLDAAAMTSVIAKLTPSAQGKSRMSFSPMLRVWEGEAINTRGIRWLKGNHSSERWKLMYVVEPFGTKSWDGVSQVGMSDGRLLAYSKPLGLIATLTPPDFEVSIQRGEPSKYSWPERRPCDLPAITQLFRAHDLWCGLTRDGAVAFLEEKS